MKLLAIVLIIIIKLCILITTIKFISQTLFLNSKILNKKYINDLSIILIIISV